MTGDWSSKSDPSPRTEVERSARARTKWLRGSGPSWPILVTIAAALIVGVMGLLAAGVAGVSDGLDLREAQKATVVSEHFSRGVGYLDSNELILAEAEFARVLQIAPDHMAARTRLEVLSAANQAPVEPSPTAKPAPTVPATVEPSAQATDMGPLITLLQDARELMQEGHWVDAILRLEQLRAIAPNFESELVEELLFESNMSQAQDLIEEDHLEAALRALDRALAFRPDDPAALEEQSLLILYSQGVGTMRADWEAAIFALSQLHARKPDYRDVAQRLFQSHSKYARSLSQREEWCVAAYHLQAALDLSADQSVAELLDEAQSRCQ